MNGRTSPLALLAALLLTTGTGLPARAQDPAPLKQKALPATAYVLTAGQAGTGCLIDAGRGLMLTCHHVVPEGDTVSVVFPVYGPDGRLILDRNFYLRQGERHAVSATVLARDEERDLALLQLHRLPDGTRPVALAPEGAAPGDWTVRLGSPAAAGETWQASPATVKSAGACAFRYQGTGQRVRCRVLATDGPHRPGDSGGPVLNARGELVGINAAFRHNDRCAIAIDLTEIRAFLTRCRPVSAAQAVPAGPTAVLQ